MDLRGRSFFGVTELTAWKFAAVNILQILSLFRGKKELHGQIIQKAMKEMYDGVWVIGNDLLYRVLNAYEERGFLESSWAEHNEDEDIRSIRYYKITPQGINQLHALKNTYLGNAELIIEILQQSLQIIWGDDKPQAPTSKPKPLSSTVFTVLNILNFLYRQTHALPFYGEPKAEITLSDVWFYAKSIQEELADIYKNKWSPSDGVLYPQLSKLSTKKILQTRWTYNGEEGFSKKRTVREYQLTTAGKEYFLELIAPEAGLKNRIIDLIGFYQKSITFIYGQQAERERELKRYIS